MDVEKGQLYQQEGGGACLVLYVANRAPPFEELPSMVVYMDLDCKVWTLPYGDFVGPRFVGFNVGTQLNDAPLDATPFEVACSLQQRAYDVQARAREYLVGVRLSVLHDEEWVGGEVTEVTLDPKHGLTMSVALHRKDGTMEQRSETLDLHELRWEDAPTYNDVDIDMASDVLSMRLDPEGWNFPTKED